MKRYIKSKATKTFLTEPNFSTILLIPLCTCASFSFSLYSFLYMCTMYIPVSDGFVKKKTVQIIFSSFDSIRFHSLIPFIHKREITQLIFFVYGSNSTDIMHRSVSDFVYVNGIVFFFFFISICYYSLRNPALLLLVHRYSHWIRKKNYNKVKFCIISISLYCWWKLSGKVYCEYKYIEKWHVFW